MIEFKITAHDDELHEEGMVSIKTFTVSTTNGVSQSSIDKQTAHQLKRRCDELLRDMVYMRSVRDFPEDSKKQHIQRAVDVVDNQNKRT